MGSGVVRHSFCELCGAGEVLFSRTGDVLHLNDTMLSVMGARDTYDAVSQWNFSDMGDAVAQAVKMDAPFGVTAVLAHTTGSSITLAVLPSLAGENTILARCMAVSESCCEVRAASLPTGKAVDSGENRRLLDGEVWHASCDELNVGIFLRDSRGRFLECNNAFKRLFGWWENAPDADAAVPAAVRRLLGNKDSMLWNTGVPQEHIGPLEYANDGGMLYTVRTCLIRLPDSGRRVSMGSVVAVRDDSGIARLEAERNLFRAAFDRTGIPTVVMDENGYFKYVNTYFSRKFGYTRQEAEGVMHFSHCFTPRSYESMKAYRERRLLGDELVPTSYEAEIVLSDGAVRNVIITSNLIPGTRQVVATAIDITEQIEAQRGHALLAHSVDRLEEWVSVYSLDGSFLYVNNAYKELVGITDEEFRSGISVAEALSRRFDQEALNAAYNELVTTGVWKGRMEYEEQSGKRVVQGGAWRIKGPDGFEDLVVSIGVDISEQIRLEERVIAAEKMEAVGVMTASIAHDFNNLLSPLLLNSQRILSETGTEFAYRREIEDIAAIAERGKAMVAQVMDLSRNDAHEIEPVDPYALVEQSVRLFRKSLPGAITLELQIENTTGYIPGAPVLVHQIISNLLFNARQAMPEGTITVRVDSGSNVPWQGGNCDDCSPVASGTGVTCCNAGENFSCFWGHERCVLEEWSSCCPECLNCGQGCRIDGWVAISVRDEGEGIPEGLHSKVFAPFFTTRTRGAGVGLGLSIVKRAVERMGGCVFFAAHERESAEIDSAHVPQKAQGACATVLLPRCVNVPVREPALRPDLAGSGRHILLVDDDRDALHAVAALHCKNYSVSAFSDPSEALSYLCHHAEEVGLVLVDWLMPDMRGDEFLTRLRKEAGNVPCVLCTGYSAGLTPAGAKQMGFADVILKPLELDMLIATVSGILGSNDTDDSQRHSACDSERAGRIE